MLTPRADGILTTGDDIVVDLQRWRDGDSSHGAQLRIRSEGVFFYVWLQEEGGWRIVVSHDAVSRDPLG
jgi:hypothetical protein